MGKQRMARSHVERRLQDVWDVCRVTADCDGDYPFRNGTAMGFVQLDLRKPAMVRIWAVAVAQTPKTAKLIYELNDVNIRSRSAWTTWSNGRVIVEQAMPLHSLTRKSLKQALNAVGEIANDIGPMIAAVYGGETPFQPGDAEFAEGAA
ncbi:MAG TPA: hypothetical protein VHC43_10240 [Mycobacteriales bacterium]|nr:hypothetical protein [Mycobacteriales bacterium]